jgi:hypothetical protein
MNARHELVITIAIQLPDGATARVVGSNEPPPSTLHELEGAETGWECPIHHSVKTVPAGVSQKTGKPYSSFQACSERGCDEKPPRA